MHGPDLVNNLIGVLVRFRENGIGVIGDIEKIYYQVKVPCDQRDFLRLFWLNEHGEITQYRLKVHVFGATSSQSVANYVLKKCASLTNNDAKYAIKNNFYVDDYLGSYPSERDAVKVAQNVRSAVSLGGFNLTSFISNSPTEVQKLGSSVAA